MFKYDVKPSNESFYHDITHQFWMVGGKWSAVISAAVALHKMFDSNLSRVKSKFEKMKPEIKKLRKSIADLPSHYLIYQTGFSGGQKALNALADYCLSVDPSKFNPGEALKTLNGSIFVKGTDKFKSSFADTVNSTIMGASRLIPAALNTRLGSVIDSHSAFYLTIAGNIAWITARTGENVTDSAGQKGWTSEKLKAAIPDMEAYIGAMEKANKIIDKCKAFKSDKDEDVAAAGVMMTWAKYILHQAGYIGRGYNVLAEKATSGVFNNIVMAVTGD